MRTTKKFCGAVYCKRQELHGAHAQIIMFSFSCSNVFVFYLFIYLATLFGSKFLTLTANTEVRKFFRLHGSHFKYYQQNIFIYHYQIRVYYYFAYVLHFFFHFHPIAFIN